MIPVYYFDKLPEKLPDDDACYIVSKHIYLKKRSGLIDSMVQVESIDMGSVLPEYARMNLPKIKAKVIGKVFGFFRMVYGRYSSEAGVILNLHTHPQKENLKRIDFTVPHQRVSGGGCKYQIVVDPSYVNCGTIHSHSNFGAFHSGTDVNDERYFDGLHITIGHNDSDVKSISACIVVNGKRIKVNPLDYIEGIKRVEGPTRSKDDFYALIDPSLAVEDTKHLEFVTPQYVRPMTSTGYVSPAAAKNQQKIFDWEAWKKDVPPTLERTVPCKECIFKEIKLDELEDIVFFDSDEDDDLLLEEEFGEEDRKLFEGMSSDPLFKVGEVDEDGVKRKNRRLTFDDFEREKAKRLQKSIKCSCGTTFFLDDPEKENQCPSCEKRHPAQRFTFMDFMNLQDDEIRIDK